MNHSILIEVKDTNDSWELTPARVPAIDELIRIGKNVYTVRRVMFTPCNEGHCAKIQVTRTRPAGPED
jgi:hypothetical protein